MKCLRQKVDLFHECQRTMSWISLIREFVTHRGEVLRLRFVDLVVNTEREDLSVAKQLAAHAEKGPDPRWTVAITDRGCQSAATVRGSHR